MVGATPTADISTALDDAEISAGANEADSILYIGGPPRLNEVRNVTTDAASTGSSFKCELMVGQ